MIDAADLPDLPRPFLLVVSDDLLLPSRIREAARPLGYDVQTAASEAAAGEAVRKTPPPRAVLVGLNTRRFDPLGFIRALKADSNTQSLFVLAFAGHVETEKHTAAREAGADLVVANSSVALHLPQILARLAVPVVSSEQSK